MTIAFDLNTIWFALVGALLAGYAILDGFDLGVGALHLLTKTDHDRRIMLNSIGPVWDGNEVWLVTGGGALFAAFPHVYATVFSGFYMAFMLLLFSLIFRAVAIEFRSKQPMAWWRSLWDVCFSVSSIVSSILIGVALGNVMWGIAVGPDREYQGTFFDLLNPYSLLVGVLILTLFTMHGSIYVVMKTEGELHDRIRGWVKYTMIWFILMFGITTLATLLYVPHMAQAVRSNAYMLAVPVLGVLAIANIPRQINKGNDFAAFLSSCAAILILMTLFGLNMYPNLVHSSLSPEYSLTVYNSASSPKTLQIMLIMALIGMPLVIAYTSCIYWIFRGKTRIVEESY